MRPRRFATGPVLRVGLARRVRLAVRARSQREKAPPRRTWRGPQACRTVPALALCQRSHNGLVRRTANRLNTTCVESQGVVSGRAARNPNKLSCDPLRHSTYWLMVLSLEGNARAFRGHAPCRGLSSRIVHDVKHTKPAREQLYALRAPGSRPGLDSGRTLNSQTWVPRTGRRRARTDESGNALPGRASAQPSQPPPPRRCGGTRLPCARQANGGHGEA